MPRTITLAAATLSVLSLPIVTHATDFSAWKASQKISINTTSSGAGIDQPVTGFPLLVRLNCANFDFSQAAFNGADVRFSKSDGTTALPYEIEQWSSQARTATIWVKVDTVRPNDGTQFIRMYYGNTAASPASCPSGVFSTGNNFCGVWHLSESKAGRCGTALYANATAGVKGLDYVADTGKGGVMGAGQRFNGSKDFIQFKSPTNFSLDKAVTFETWLRNDWTFWAWWSHLWGDWTGMPSMEFAVREGRLYLGVREKLASGPDADNVWGSQVLSKNQWHHVAVSFDRGAFRTYVDGRLDREYISSAVKDINNSGSSKFTGCKDSLGSFPFCGALDEFRLSRVARSASWIRLCYENQKQGSEVVRVGSGSEDDRDGDGVPNWVETALGHNPLSSSDKPAIAVPSAWEVPVNAASDVVYINPFDSSRSLLHVPAEALPSGKAPVIELASIGTEWPGNLQQDVRPEQDLCGFWRLEGTIAAGKELLFPFPYSAVQGLVGQHSLDVMTFNTNTHQWESVGVDSVITRGSGSGVAYARLKHFSYYMLVYTPGVVAVDANVSCSGTCIPDGSSWAKAFPSLSQALDVVRSNPKYKGVAVEMWIADGTYTPEGEPGDRGATFDLRADAANLWQSLTLLGGFAGNESAFITRNVAKNPTILSGEVGAIDDRTDNLNVVVTAGSSTTLNGLIIEDGSTGARVDDATNVAFQNCVFRNNGHEYATRMDGASGLCAYRTGALSVSGCVFQGNLEQHGAGGAFLYGCTGATLTNCVFADNLGGLGAGLHVEGDGYFLSNCVFANNHAGGQENWARGGGLVIYGNNNRIAGCTFSGNRGFDGSGALMAGGRLAIVNSIFWGNRSVVPWGASQILNEGTMSLSHCVVQGGLAVGEVRQPGDCYPGQVPYDVLGNALVDDGSNISADPQFLSPALPAGDDGKFFTWDDGLRLSRFSSCLFTAADAEDSALWSPGSPWYRVTLGQDIMGQSHTYMDPNGNFVWAQNADIGAYWSALIANPALSVDFVEHPDQKYGTDKLVYATSMYNGRSTDPNFKSDIDSVYISLEASTAGGPRTETCIYLQLDHALTASSVIARVRAGDESAVKLSETSGGTPVTQLPIDTRRDMTPLYLVGGQLSGTATIDVDNLIEIVANGQMVWALKVVVMSKRTIAFRYYRVVDPNSPVSSSMPDPSFEDIERQMNDILKQTCTEFRIVRDESNNPSTRTLNRSFDLNRNGVVDLFDETYVCSGTDWEHSYPATAEDGLAGQGLTNLSSIYYAPVQRASWVIVSNPSTGLPPKSGDTEIYVCMNNPSGRLPYSGSPLWVGPATDGTVEQLSCKGSSRSVDVARGIYAVPLSRALIGNHLETIGTNANGKRAFTGSTLCSLGGGRTAINSGGTIYVRLFALADWAHEVFHSYTFYHVLVGSDNLMAESWNSNASFTKLAYRPWNGVEPFGNFPPRTEWQWCVGRNP